MLCVSSLSMSPAFYVAVLFIHRMVTCVKMTKAFPCACSPDRIVSTGTKSSHTIVRVQLFEYIRKRPSLRVLR